MPPYIGAPQGQTWSLFVLWTLSGSPDGNERTSQSMKNRNTHDNTNNFTYTYYAWNDELKREVPVTITAGKDGVTELDIQKLREMDHDFDLNERYADENRDYKTENSKRCNADELSEDDKSIDPIENLGSSALDPGIMIDRTVCENPKIEQVRFLLNMLTPKQADFIYDTLGSDIAYIKIAKAEGVSPAAINHRKVKTYARFKKLAEEYGFTF